MAISSAMDGTAVVDHIEAIHTTKAIADATLKPEISSNIDIIDIRHDAVSIDLKGEILNLLRPEHGPKRMPTMLLYDERGLQLFEEARNA